MTTPNGTAYTVLTAAEARSAGALFERLFPADERGPGARDIGVVEYVDRALYGHDKRLVPTYKLMLAAVEAARQSAHGRLARGGTGARPSPAGRRRPAA